MTGIEYVRYITGYECSKTLVESVCRGEPDRLTYWLAAIPRAAPGFVPQRLGPPPYFPSAISSSIISLMAVAFASPEPMRNRRILPSRSTKTT